MLKLVGGSKPPKVCSSSRTRFIALSYKKYSPLERYHRCHILRCRTRQLHVRSLDVTHNLSANMQSGVAQCGSCMCQTTDEWLKGTHIQRGTQTGGATLSISRLGVGVSQVYPLKASGFTQLKVVYSLYSLHAHVCRVFWTHGTPGRVPWGKSDSLRFQDEESSFEVFEFL